MHLIVFTTVMVAGTVMLVFNMASYMTLYLMGAVSLVGWLLNRAGHTRASALLLIGALLITIQYNLYMGYGIHDVAVIAWPALIIFIGLLFGWRAIPYTTTIIMILATAANLIPNQQVAARPSDTGDLIVMVMVLVAFSLIAMSMLRGNDHLILELHHSDERFQTIYHSINDAIFIHDPQSGAILDVNQKMLDMFGYSRSEALQLDIGKISSGDPPYTQESALNWIKKAAAEGEQNFEWQSRHKNGQLFWVDVNMKQATLDGQVRILVSVRDISQRKQAEEERRESARIFEIFFNNNPVMTIIARVDTSQIINVNEAFTRISGYSREEAIGRTSSDFNLWVDAELRLHYIQELRQKGYCENIEVKFRRKDGSLRDGVVSARTASMHGVPISISITYDITERKQAELALRESEERFQQIADLMPQIVFESDLQGNITFGNQYARKLVGVGADGPKVNFFDFLDEAQREKAMKTIQGMVNGAAESGYEYEIRLADGRRIPVLIFSTVVRKQNQPTGLRGIVVDITTIKNSERALRESEERYRLLYENSLVGLYRTTPDGRFLVANPTMIKLVGFSSFEELSSRSLDQGGFEVDYDRSQFIEMMERNGEVKGLEASWTRLDGTTIFTRESARLTRDAQGNALYYDGIVEDITDLKRAEDARKTAEASYRSIYENATTGIFQSTPEGRFRAVNPAMAHIYGYDSPEDMLASITDISAQIYVDPASRAEFQRQLAERGAVTEFIGENYRKDGSIIWTLTSARVVKDSRGKILYYEGFLSDVSERKQAEEALRESEAKFRAVVENSNDGVLFCDASGLILYRSPSYDRINGYSNEERVGQNGFETIHPDDLDAARRVWARVLEIPDLSDRLEYRIRHKDGSWRWIETSVRNLLHNPDVQAMVVNSHDITERKQRENELQTIIILSAALRTFPNRAEMLPELVKQISLLLSCDAITIEIIDPHSGEAVVEAGYGAWARLTGRRQPPGTGLNMVIQKTRQPLHLNNLAEDSHVKIPGYENDGFTAIAGVPLIAQDQVIGFFWIGQKTEISPSEIRLLTAMADIAANAVHRATLHERTLKNALDLTLAYDTTLEGWAHALELRDHETEGHARSVVQLTVKLARLMGIPEADLEHIRRGALLHDIGKMGIPDAVLLKPGPLNEREWEVMRRHPEYAYNLLKPIDYLRPVLDISYCHHERWDSSGYPRGLKGEEIPLAARIFAIVDVWDALRSDRPYRKAWPDDEARRYIIAQSGKQFDPRVVEAFLGLLKDEDLE